MKIAFLKGRGIIDLAIRLWTWSKYSHCEIIFNDGRTFGCDVSFPGTTKYTKKTYDPAYWDIFNLDISLEQENIIRKFTNQEVNCKYDWIGIFFTQFIPLGFEMKARWFCSEVVTAAFQKIGWLLGIQPKKVSPKKLFDLIISNGYVRH